MEDKPEIAQIEEKRVILAELPVEGHLKTYRNWENFTGGVDSEELYSFLCSHHEHVFKDQKKMEGYLKKVFDKGGSVVVDREPKIDRIVGFADGRPQESSYGKMFVISEVTSERGAFQSIAALLGELVSGHSDCEAVLFSLPQESEGDKRRARIYQKVGFKENREFTSAGRVCYSMPMDELSKKIRIFTERR